MALTPEEQKELEELESRAGGKTPWMTPQQTARMQGLTSEFYDEIEGVLRALKPERESPYISGYPERYRQYRDAVRAQQKRYGGEEFWGKLGNEALGMSPWLLLTRGRSGAAKLPELIKEGAKMGAAQGALGGYGASEGDVPEQALGTALGATTGGVLGSVIPGAVEGVVKPGIGAVSRAIRNKGTPASGRDKILEALERDKSSPDELARLYDELTGSPGLGSTVGYYTPGEGKPVSLLDVSSPGPNVAGLPNLNALAEAAVTVPGKGKAAATKALSEKTSAQQSRIEQDLNLLSPLKDYGKRLTDLERSLGEKSAPFYKRAFDQGEVTDPETIAMLADRPALEKAFSRAKVRAANRGEKEPGPPTVLMLHHTKMALDDMIGEAITKGARGEAGELMALKRELLGKIEQAAPSYREAREIYSGGKELQNAAELGRQFMKEDTWVTQDILDGMSPEALEMFRMGAVQKFRDMIGRSKQGTDATKAMQVNTRGFGERLASLFPDKPEVANSLLKRLELEGRMYDAGSRILSNSPTARRQAAIQDLKEDAPAVSDLIGKSTRQMLLDVLDRFGGSRVKSATGSTPEATDEIMRVMTETDPKVVSAIIDELNQQAAKNDKEAARRLMIYRDKVIPLIARQAGTVTAPEDYERQPR